MFIFLSPHFDDAVGSAGGAIQRLTASGGQCRVMTIMAAVPWFRVKSALYVLCRRREDRDAAELLGCGVQNAPFLDAVYRKDIRRKIARLSKKHLFTAEITEHALVNQIREFILENTRPDDVLIAPAGFGGHIDHRIVNLAVKDIDRPLYFYEEFFYDTKESSRALTDNYEYLFLSRAETEKKLMAMMRYKRTLRKLFGRNWKKKTTAYFTEEHTSDSKAYERFNKLFICPGS